MTDNTDNKKTILYMHAGSKNHGCEAIVNSLIRMIGRDDNILLSYRAGEDNEYSLKDMCDIRGEKSFDDHKIAHILYYIYRKLTKDNESFIRYRYGELLSKKDQSDKYPVAISIGGDNYCYDVMLNDLKLANSAFNRQGTRTILLGCSIEPEILEKESIADDLKKYSVITARESITYEALKKRFDGIQDSPEIYCIPDPAFTLPKREGISLPEGFDKTNTVGINVSPMVRDNESVAGITMEAYKSLTEFILEETDMNVMFVPHVVWNNNDDREPINELQNFFSEKGFLNRIYTVSDNDCETLKAYIAGCRLFVGARTHSTIAAYSSGVPTLVVGYSVKALGIAKDLFPGWDVDELVFPVQKIKDKDDLRSAFINLLEKEDQIRKHLNDFMPDYIKKARSITEILTNI